MADSLDDFFAKKDKSKKKTKSKIKPEDILSQQPVQVPVAVQEKGDVLKSTKKNKKSKEKKAEVEAVDSNKEKKQVDEEWKDYAEEEKVDYTGLRIREMQLAKAAQEEKEEEERKEEEEAENQENREGGPWNKAESDGTEIRHVPEPEPPKPEAPKPTAASGKYVPPSRRGEGAAAAAGPAARRKKKEAPNLHSEHDFPTLGGADYTQGGEFEEVKVGTGGHGRHTDEHNKQRLNLQLDNKFGALQDDDS